MSNAASGRLAVTRSEDSCKRLFTMTSQSYRAPIRAAREALKALGIRLRLVSSPSRMPRTIRAFEEVDYHDGLLVHLRIDTELANSLWHEVGHAVTSDAGSFVGSNWCTPMPRHLPFDDTESGLEIEACAGTLLAMIAAHRPLSEIRSALVYGNALFFPSEAQGRRKIAARLRVRALLGRIRDSAEGARSKKTSPVTKGACAPPETRA